VICEFTDQWGNPHGLARFNICDNRAQLEYDLRFPHTKTGTDWIEWELMPTSNGIREDGAMILCGSLSHEEEDLVLR
jgi:hypothetical protein